MKASKSIVVFFLEGHRYGMPLDMVERVAPVVEVTPIPDAPDAVLGIINVRGAVIPVISVRKKLGMGDRQLKLSDQLLICRVSDRRLAVLVDGIEGAQDYEEDLIVKAEMGSDGPDVLKTADGIVYLYDYERLLNSREQQILNTALEKVQKVSA